MKPEVRIAALIFGGLALVLVVLVGITYLILPAPAKSALAVLVDRGSANRVAHEIATYRLPPGYHLITAFESAKGERMAIFGPLTDRRVMITLRQAPQPERQPPAPDTTREACAKSAEPRSETLIIDARPTPMKIWDCKVSFQILREEVGFPRLHGRRTVVLATGSSTFWNADELHAFLTSLH